MLTAGTLAGQGGPAADALDRALDQAQTAQAGAHYADAAAAYAKATALRPGLAELWANRGLMEHLAGLPQAALDSFGRALALKPQLFAPLLFSGVDYVATGKPERALPFLKRALAAQPENPEALLAAGKAYLASNQPREAAAAYQTLSQIQAGSAGAWYGLALASLAVIDRDGGSLARTHTTSAWSKALYADELLEQGRTDEAIELYRQAAATAGAADRQTLLRTLESLSNSSLSPETLATLQSALGPATGTTDRCASGRAGDPLCAYLSGDDATVAARAAALLAAHPSDPESLFWSVKANERRAVASLARFEELSPQSPVTFDLAGDLFRRRSLPDKARGEYARALALDAHDPAALLGTAAAHLGEGHPGPALDSARLGLADRPDDAKLNLIAGEALVNQHQFTEAEPYLRRSLRTSDPSAAPYAHALLGRVAAEREDTATAIAELRLGLPSDRDGSLHYQLYRLLRKTGDTAGAQAAEAQARALQTQRLANAVTAVGSSAEPRPF